MRPISDKYTCTVIGKPINGISLNGLEYLMIEGMEGVEAPFVDKADAVDFLHTVFMMDDQMIEDTGIVFRRHKLDAEWSGAFYTSLDKDTGKYEVFNEAPCWIYEGDVVPMTIDTFETGPFTRFSDAFRDAQRLQAK